MSFRKKRNSYYKYVSEDFTEKIIQQSGTDILPSASSKSRDSIHQDLVNEYRVTMHAVKRYLTRVLDQYIPSSKLDKRTIEYVMKLIVDELPIDLIHSNIINSTQAFGVILPDIPDFKAIIKDGLVITVKPTKAQGDDYEN